MRMSSQGLDNLIKSFDKLEGSTSEIMHKAVYQAAGIIADEVKSGLRSLPVDDGKRDKIDGATSTEKEDLIASMGIAPHREDNGSVTTSIGFSGKSSIKTKRFPAGVPNAVLMRSIESGTSIRKKHPVIRPALARVRKRAVEAAKKEAINEIQKEI